MPLITGRLTAAVGVALDPQHQASLGQGLVPLVGNLEYGRIRAPVPACSIVGGVLLNNGEPRRKEWKDRKTDSSAPRPFPILPLIPSLPWFNMNSPPRYSLPQPAH